MSKLQNDGGECEPMQMILEAFGNGPGYRAANFGVPEIVDTHFFWKSDCIHRPSLTMTLEDLLKCARPLLFENDDPEFGYSLGPSAFICTLAGKYFAVTARHCWKTFEPNQILVEFKENAAKFLPIRNLHTPITEEIPPPEWADLAFLEISHEHLSQEDVLELSAFDLNHLAVPGFKMVEGESLLAVRGYPYELSVIDYDAHSMVRQAYMADALYEGLSADHLCHRLRFKEKKLVGDFNGLSGSPVFHVKKVSHALHWRFVGVLIRANAGSGFGHFIESSVVHGMLHKLVNSQ